MIQTVKKRDGRLAHFDKLKIATAISRAGYATHEFDFVAAESLSSYVVRGLDKPVMSVEEIQDEVERVLMQYHPTTAKAYILYRAERTRIREAKAALMDEVSDIVRETTRDNANISNSPSAKMLQIASATSKQFYLSRVIPPDLSKGHRSGDFHIHDLDFYGKTLTCVHIPLGRLLERGFDTGHGYIRPPKHPRTATALAAIILQSCQNDMHGGQSFAFFDRDMAPYMERADEEEVYQAMEGLVFNLNSMHSRAGAQVPFSSINLGAETDEAARKVTRSFLSAYNAGLGKGENPIFPNVIFRVKQGVNTNPEDPNYDLFQLAIKVASRRLNPTFLFIDTPFNSPYGTEVATMGCRTRVIANRHGAAVTDCRGNLSFTTLNLPRIAIQSKGNMCQFWSLLNERVAQVAQQLHHRFKIQSNLRVADMPFLMGQKLYMDSDSLASDDLIGPAIKHGTLAVGFIGLAETLKVLTGYHHGESEDAQDLGLLIIRHLRRLVDQAADAYDLNYTLLATPAEGLSGRFVDLDKDRFGIIAGVTDKEYYTNSFHVPVDYAVSAEVKLSIEAPYHELCNAGHISYVEMKEAPIHNPQAVESVIKLMGSLNIGYGGINYPIDFCTDCGTAGYIPDNCPKCGSSSIRRVRRITGYLSTVDRFNDAKQAELRDRRVHI